jgi:ribosomal protein S18 acetylase RimI-like enzyme
MTTSPLIRHAVPDDASRLAAFATEAFTDTYRELDDPQDIADYCGEHFRADVMAGVIEDPACTVLLAEQAGELAGYAILKDRPAPACVTGPAPLQLWRLYLGAGFIGRGLGARLMQAVQAGARQRGAATLWLGVYDRNLRAVAFYERFGFARVGSQAFVFGGEVYLDPVYAAPVPPAPALSYARSLET